MNRENLVLPQLQDSRLSSSVTFVDSGLQEKVKSLKVLLKEGEHFFELEYVSSLDTFDQSLPQVQESINSLQLEML